MPSRNGGLSLAVRRLLLLVFDREGACEPRVKIRLRSPAMRYVRTKRATH
jgi:hypothetical protein